MSNAIEPPNKDTHKQENYRRFVNAAREILDEGGISRISIRKIAERAGLHNSTIYLYFADLDQLIMLASVKYFQEYSRALEIQSRKNLPPSENFINIWTLFVDATLTEPCVFFNFFFGRRSDNLKDILNLYYEIFPEERDQFSDDIERMYFGSNIFDRSLELLYTIAEEDNLVTQDNMVMLTDITVSYCENKLMKKCQNPEMDSDKIKDDILRMIHYIHGL